MKTWERLLYALARTLVVGFCRGFWRVTVEGSELVPRSGAFILAPVHRSNTDTPLVAAITKRRLRYMGKESMWKVKPIGRLFTALGSFPVNRDIADREALRRAQAILEGGEPLVMFPEGTRRSGPTVQPLEQGTAYLSLRAGVPIVPVGIAGSERAMPRGAKMIRPTKVHIVVGPPIRPERGEGTRIPRSEIRRLSERLSDELQVLFDRANAAIG